MDPSRTTPELGIITPVLTMLPRAHATWEAEGTIDDVVAVVRRAEDLGYHHATCSEHVAIPRPVAEVRGARYWDPLATFGFLAAHTSRIALATHVLVLGYHHPLEIAKRYGTLDRITGGRLVLGVGVGSLREEFDLLDAAFTDRGERADDALRALRAAFGRAEPEYTGSHYEFSGFVVDPPGVQADIPIWIGGRSARSLRRAVELADGWAPFGLAPDEVATMLGAARDRDGWRDLAVWLQPERPLDPAGDPDDCAARVGDLVRAGATGINCRFVHHSRAHYCEQLEAMAALTASSSR